MLKELNGNKTKKVFVKKKKKAYMLHINGQNQERNKYFPMNSNNKNWP